MNKRASDFSDEQRNAAREQIVINTRLTALGVAQDLMKVQAHTELEAKKVVEFAAEIEAYLLKDIQAVKPKSGIVLQTQMPPPNMFKPGAN